MCSQTKPTITNHDYDRLFCLVKVIVARSGDCPQPPKKTARKQGIYYLTILLLFLLLSGCQITTQEEIVPLPTLSITYSPSGFPLEAPTTSGVNPSSTLTPKSTATPIQPSPSKIVLTPLPTLLPAPAAVDEAVLYGMDIDRENQIYALQPGGTSRFIIKGRMPGQSLSPDKTKLIVNANDLPRLDDSPDEVFIYDFVCV